MFSMPLPPSKPEKFSRQTTIDTEVEDTMHDWKKIELVCLAGLGILAGTFGCGKSQIPNRKTVIPVKGTVFVGGRPAAGAVVCFHPLADPGSRALRSNGRVGDDGAFSLTTYVMADGAPEGEYVITVYWADPSKKPRNEDEESDLPPDLLKGRFATRQVSVLRAKVGGKATEFAPVDLGSNEVVKSREYCLREK